jgi:hypothetical protein
VFTDRAKIILGHCTQIHKHFFIANIEMAHLGTGNPNVMSTSAKC